MFSAKSVERRGREQLLRDKVSVCLVLRVWYLGTRLVCV